MDSRVRLSKALSLILRHKPWLYELELDDQGWTPLAPVLEGLRGSRPEWHDLTEADLREVVETSDKSRYEMREGQIRALYGHSIPGRIEKIPAAPPELLYHGTPRAVLPGIRANGLRPMSRQYVHLAAALDMARQVGQRKGGDTVILEIEGRRAHEASVVFYRGNNLVWLADRVPPQFIVFPLDA